MKTVYVAARFAKKDEVREIFLKLESLGYVPSEDWTQHKLIKPYVNNPKLSEEYAVVDINGAKNADLFILISDEAGTGMHTELGAAIANNIDYKKPDIYVIGLRNARSAFFYHPTVKRRLTIDEVIEEIAK